MIRAAELLVGVLLLAACSGAAGAVADASLTLKHAAPRDLQVGAAVDAGPLRDEPAYARALAREYDSVTPENAMKWKFIHPGSPPKEVHDADAIAAFARQHHMKVRGHTLVWYREVPEWVTKAHWTRAGLEQVLRDHIRTVVTRYRDVVDEWDVVNEALDKHGELRDSVWKRVIGPDYIALAFRWAHEADPTARLFYNDYDLERPGPKARAAVALVRGLQGQGVPITGVGIQGHELTVRAPSRADLDHAVHSFTDLGLDVAMTEVDVGIHLPASRRERHEQADVYRDVLDACLDTARCTSFTTWGITDRHSWVPGRVDGFGDALPFDRHYRPKPAADALRARLARGRA